MLRKASSHSHTHHRLASSGWLARSLSFSSSTLPASLTLSSSSRTGGGLTSSRTPPAAETAAAKSKRSSPSAPVRTIGQLGSGLRCPKKAGLKAGLRCSIKIKIEIEIENPGAYGG